MDTQFLAYKKIIENENRVGKSNIRLRNLYKISQYKYDDGKSKNLVVVMYHMFLYLVQLLINFME